VETAAGRAARKKTETLKPYKLGVTLMTAVSKLDTYEALDRNIGSDLDGELLRFNGKTGKFFRGPEKVEVPHGRRLKFAPLSVQDGWQRWEGGKIVEERFREWNSTQPPILRNDLGDFDEGAWPEDKDPWTFALRTAFQDARGNLLKFVTSSTGGVNAIRKLLRDWRQDRGNHPGDVPIVALGSDSYHHRIHHTDIVTPKFTISGWGPWDGPMPTVPTVTPKALPPGGVTADDPRTLAEEINDEIPGWR
jgi:hypothetical protein